MYDEFRVPFGCGQVKMYNNVLDWFEIGCKVPTYGWPESHSVYLRNHMWANVTKSVYTSITSAPEHPEMFNKWGYYVDNKGNFIDSGKPSYGRINMNKLPAGKYWVGDCCYFIDPEIDWSQEFCEPFFENEYGEPFLIRGIPVAASSTMYGDGSYTSNIDFEFGVDAGLIGVIPESLAKTTIMSSRLGVLVDFKEDFTVSYENGTIYIGHIKIYTNDEDEREDEDWFFSPNN